VTGVFEASGKVRKMEELKKYMQEAAAFMDRTAGVLDHEGLVLASTDVELEGTEDSVAKAVLASDKHIVFSGDRAYMKIDRTRNSLICFVDGKDEQSQVYLELLKRWIESSYVDKDNVEEKETFIKNVLLENELPGDVPLKARDLKIAYPVPRQIYIVRVNPGKSADVLTVLEHLFPDWERDFVFPMDEENIVVMLEIHSGDKSRTASEESSLILDTINTEAKTHAYIGVSMPAETLKDTAKSYREASMALIVGQIFDEESSIMRYDRLGLGRLIYQLPKTLCELFLSEVFEEGAYEALDDETLLTIQKFFENNLNGSETSRQLFVHRNTLVYRLDKVEKITGLDLRNFDDAVLFKLAQMVRKYLEYQDAGNKTAGSVRGDRKSGSSIPVI
jgi:carbohydrate diacid regulator